MAEKVPEPKFGDRWLIRNKGAAALLEGAAALLEVDVLDCHKGRVYALRTRELMARAYYAQAGVDFEFVQPSPTEDNRG